MYQIQNSKKGTFWTSKTQKIDFTMNMSGSKILKCPLCLRICFLTKTKYCHFTRKPSRHPTSSFHGIFFTQRGLPDTQYVNFTGLFHSETFQALVLCFHVFFFFVTQRQRPFRHAIRWLHGTFSLRNLLLGTRFYVSTEILHSEAFQTSHFVELSRIEIRPWLNLSKCFVLIMSELLLSEIIFCTITKPYPIFWPLTFIFSYRRAWEGLLSKVNLSRNM